MGVLPLAQRLHVHTHVLLVHTYGSLWGGWAEALRCTYVRSRQLTALGGCISDSSEILRVYSQFNGKINLPKSRFKNNCFY